MPSIVPAHLGLASYHLAKGHPRDAVRIAEAGLAIVDVLALPDYRYLHSTRGELLRRLGRIEEARDAYGRALTLVHDDAERRLLERRLAEPASG